MFAPKTPQAEPSRESPASEDPWTSGPDTPLAWALWCYLTQPLLPALATLAALGRAAQVGWAEGHSSVIYWLLELPIEGARAALLVAMLGAGDLRRGITAIRVWSRERTLDITGRTVRRRAGALARSVLVMAAFVLVSNWTIARAASSETALVLGKAWLDAPESAATLAAELFLKNLTVIPIMILWYGGLYRMLRER